jgi:hypothetical protein
LLARGLFVAAVLVLVFSIVGAIQVATSESNVLFFEDVQRENRGPMAIASLGAGVFGAGVLAGLGAILLLMLDRDRR